MTKFNWLTPEVIVLERFDFLDTKYIYILYTCNVYILNNNNNDDYTSHGPRHVAESYMCNHYPGYVFTHLYEEYRLQIVVDIITLYS